MDTESTRTDARLAAIEAKLDVMMAILTSPSRYDLTAGLERPGLGPFQRVALASLPPGALLVGWAEIARHCRKAPRTLKRYRDLEGVSRLALGSTRRSGAREHCPLVGSPGAGAARETGG